MIAELELSDAGAALLFEGKEIAFPPQASAAVAHICTTEGPSPRPSCREASTSPAGWCSCGGLCAKGSCAPAASYSKTAGSGVTRATNGPSPGTGSVPSNWVKS